MAAEFISLLFQLFQAVFRKLSDIRKERELEKKKDESMLPEQHPVRKIISRFRKLSLSKASFFESHQPEVSNVPVEDLNGTLVSGKRLISKLKKAASMRRGSKVAESQFLLDSPLLNSPTVTPQLAASTEGACLDVARREGLESGKSAKRGVERNSIDYALSHRKSNMLEIPSDIMEEEEEEEEEEDEKVDEYDDEVDEKSVGRIETAGRKGRFAKRASINVAAERTSSQRSKRGSKKGASFVFFHIYFNNIINKNNVIDYYFCYI